MTQLRTKLKKCISLCKQAALTLKTSTGIKRFQNKRELGDWFDQLFPVVKTRDTNQIVPTRDTTSSTAHEEETDQAETDTGKSTKMFVPIKTGHKKVKRKRMSTAQHQK